MKTYLIIVAMDVELDAVLSSGTFSDLGPMGQLIKNVYEHHSTNKRVLVTCSGVGLVNAAVTLAIIAQKINIDGVVSLGVAGSLVRSLKTGDLLICRSIIQHDCILTTDNGEELMAPGHLHLSIPRESRENPLLYTDPKLESLIVNDKIDLQKSVYGTLLSGNEFVGSNDRKTFLANKYKNSLAVDMESAGIAQIAKRMNIPFIAFKTIADDFEAEEPAKRYLKVKEMAAKNSSVIAKRILEIN